MNLVEAKAKTLDAQAQVAAHVPDDQVASSRVNDTSSVLLPCDGGYYWPGHTSMSISGDLDTDELLSKVKADWETKIGWSVSEDTSVDGLRRLDLLDSDGTQLFVMFVDGGRTLDIASFSACFDFEGEPEYGVQY